MQSKSATKKKTTKTVDAAPAVPAELNTASAPVARASKSSAPKSESTENVSAKRHRIPQATATSDPVVTSTASIASSLAAENNLVSEESIRQLAYQLWLERGRPHGSQHEDWFRAEKTLATGA